MTKTTVTLADTAGIESGAADEELRDLTRRWFLASCRHKYSYHFTWLGRPIIQYPTDLLALQEIIWTTQPDLIIETGIAHGGSLIFHASMLALLGGPRRVVGVDVEIRPHNRDAITRHPLSPMIDMIEGSSIDPGIVARVTELARGPKRVMVVLDSNHTHDHVRQELASYAELVSPGCYLVVLDTVVEDMPVELLGDRPWRPGNSPRTAVRDFLAKDPRFAVDEEIEKRLLVTVAPGGWLKRVR